jgi:hypothetical protein
MMTMPRLLAIAASFLLVASASGCVDGTTPDCSDAAAHCGPDFDGAPFEASGDGPTEGAAGDSGSDSPPDSPGDSPADGPADSPPDSPGDSPADGPKDSPAG